jgi:hypothetical protein
MGKVGAARIGDIEIRVTPKMPIRRLLFLAGYAQHGADWRPEDVALPEVPGLVPVMSQVLWRQTERAVHQGLLPGYVALEEVSYVLRGRLRETEQLHRHYGAPVPLEIRRDEFTVDIAENQILRTACERMLQVPGVDILGLRRGHLVYAKGNEEPGHHNVRGSNIEIICHAVDLDTEPAALLDQIRELADFIGRGVTAEASASGARVMTAFRNSVRGAQPISLTLDVNWLAFTRAARSRYALAVSDGSQRIGSSCARITSTSPSESGKTERRMRALHA